MGGQYQSGAYIVEKMCDLTEPLISDYNKTIFEPGCGDGNFLAEILMRRLKLLRGDRREERALLAISNIYGLDIDNTKVEKARRRLLKLLEVFFPNLDYRFLPVAANLIEHNIIYGDFLADQSTIKFPSWCEVSPYNFTPTYYTLSSILEEARCR